MTESHSQRRRAVQEREAPRVRLAPLGFALASYRVGSDEVNVSAEVWTTPGEAEAAALEAGGVVEGYRAFVVALAPVSEIPHFTPQEGPQ